MMLWTAPENSICLITSCNAPHSWHDPSIFFLQRGNASEKAFHERASKLHQLQDNQIDLGLAPTWQSRVVTVAKFQGGGAFNIIPDYVTIGGTFRAFSKESFAHLKNRIKEVITGQAAVQRCNATVHFFDDVNPLYPVTENDKDLHGYFVKVASDVLGASNIRDMQPLMGSEDFSFYSEVIPGYFFFLGMGNESSGKSASCHSPLFTVNEDALPYGSAMHASLAARYLLEYQPKVQFLGGKLHDEL